jgi:hypothetical protein
MTQRPEAVSEHLRDEAVAVMECDVPAGWSLDEWRTVRSLAREVTTEPGARWRRLLRRASRRSPAAAAARSAAR